MWEQASRAFRESAQGDEPVKELLAQASGYLGYLTPAAGIGAGVGSHALMWTLWVAYKGGYALWFVFSLGLSTIVFITCAFYMLALEVDPLTSLVNTASGDTASEETKQSIRLTVEAAILLPLNSSARNASFTLLLYGVRRRVPVPGDAGGGDAHALPADVHVALLRAVGGGAVARRGEVALRLRASSGSP